LVVYLTNNPVYGVAGAIDALLNGGLFAQRFRVIHVNDRINAAGMNGADIDDQSKKSVH
jgi:hypothetical protein